MYDTLKTPNFTLNYAYEDSDQSCCFGRKLKRENVHLKVSFIFKLI